MEAYGTDTHREIPLSSPFVPKGERGEFEEPWRALGRGSGQRVTQGSLTSILLSQYFAGSFESVLKFDGGFATEKGKRTTPKELIRILGKTKANAVDAGVDVAPVPE